MVFVQDAEERTFPAEAEEVLVRVPRFHRGRGEGMLDDVVPMRVVPVREVLDGEGGGAVPQRGERGDVVRVCGQVGEVAGQSGGKIGAREDGGVGGDPGSEFGEAGGGVEEGEGGRVDDYGSRRGEGGERGVEGGEDYVRVGVEVVEDSISGNAKASTGEAGGVESEGVIGRVVGEWLTGGVIVFMVLAGDGG